MSGVPLLRLERVSKVYANGEAEVRALDDVSLDIHAGEFEIGRASCRERV